MAVPALSPEHALAFFETSVGPIQRTVQALESEPAKLNAFRNELRLLIGTYFEENHVRQDFLMSRAIKI